MSSLISSIPSGISDYAKPSRRSWTMRTCEENIFKHGKHIKVVWNRRSSLYLQTRWRSYISNLNTSLLSQYWQQLDVFESQNYEYTEDVNQNTSVKISIKSREELSIMSKSKCSWRFIMMRVEENSCWEHQLLDKMLRFSFRCLTTQSTIWWES